MSEPEPYVVWGRSGVILRMEVDAESKQEAIDKANDQFSGITLLEPSGIWSGEQCPTAVVVAGRDGEISSVEDEFEFDEALPASEADECGETKP